LLVLSFLSFSYNSKKSIKQILKLSQNINDNVGKLLEGCESGESSQVYFHGSAKIPDGFNKVSSLVFEVDGQDHAQESYYNEIAGEVILTSPAHSGYYASTTILTEKTESKSAKIFSCHDKTCFLNDVHDELYSEPKNIMININTSPKSKRIRVDENAETFYVTRSNHRGITKPEYDTLTPSMKYISKGKRIILSDSTVSSQNRNGYFNVTDSKDTKTGRQGCGLKYGCMNKSNSCYWTFKPSDPVGGQKLSIHGVNGDETCTMCCNNDNSYPDNNDFVLCSTIRENGAQAYVTALAVSGYEFNDYSYYHCSASIHHSGHGYTHYDSSCHLFGNQFGTCVHTENFCHLSE